MSFSVYFDYVLSDLTKHFPILEAQKSLISEFFCSSETSIDIFRGSTIGN